MFNYAWVIILVTFAIKVVLLPLDLKQRSSSYKMQAMSGEVAAIKERYANAPEQAQKKIQALYKERGASPLSGCLPMIFMMVFLFAFYGALRNVFNQQMIAMVLNGTINGAEAVRLPSWLWVHNIFQSDSGMAPIMPAAADFMTLIKTNATSVSPQVLMMLKNQGILTFSNGVMSMNETASSAYNALCGNIIAANNLTGFNNGWFGLPILSGGTLFLQQFITNKITPQANQQSGTGKFMMWFFPIFSAYICLQTNACFAIYWTASNVFAIILSVAYFYIRKYIDSKKVVTAENFRK